MLIIEYQRNRVTTCSVLLYRNPDEVRETAAWRIIHIDIFEIENRQSYPRVLDWLNDFLEKKTRAFGQIESAFSRS